MASAGRWLIWVAGTFATVPVSFVVWWYWGQGFCGDEVYDTRPGSGGDALCGALVRPVWPWAIVAAAPTLLALVGGFLGLLLRRPGLYKFALLAPMAVGLLTLFLVPALF